MSRAKEPIEHEPFMENAASPIPMLPAMIEEDDEGSEDAALLSMLATIGASDSEACARLYRIKKGEPDAFIDEFSPDEFDLIEVRNKHGGGLYRVRVYTKDKRLAVNRRINIENAKEPVASSQSQLADVIAAMQQSNRELLQGIAAMIQTQQKQPTRQETLNELLALKEVFGVAAPQQSPFEVMRSTIEMMKELNPTPAGEAGGADIFLKLIDTFGKPIAEGLQFAGAAMQTNAAHPQIAPRMQPITPQLPVNPALQNNPEPQQETENMDVKKMVLKQKLQFLCGQAARGGDPVLYADLIYDNVPVDVLRNFTGNENWLTELTAVCPEVEQNAAWFGELRNSLLEIFQHENLTETAKPDNTSGDGIHRQKT